MFLGGYSEFIVEGVVPNLLHVVPIGDNAVFDGVLDGEDATLVLRFVANVAVHLAHADHDAYVTWAADDGGEDSAGSVFRGKACLAHARAVIDDHRV